MSASDSPDIETGSGSPSGGVEGAALNRISRYAPEWAKRLRDLVRYGGDVLQAIELFAQIVSDLSGGVAAGAGAARKRFKGEKVTT